MDLFTLWREDGFVPVVCPENETMARTLGAAMAKSPLRAVEITMRHPFATEAIRLLKKEYPALVVGAGTVMTALQAKEAAEAGAAFLVAPGFNPEVAEVAVQKELPYIPGCATPTEMMTALRAGCEALKLFPADQCGGVGMLKAVASVLPGVGFMATGGVNEENLGSFLAQKNLLCCGGSFAAPKALLQEGKTDEVAAILCRVSDICRRSR